MSIKSWPVQDAKARFSELLDACVKHGPQVVTRRGAPIAVLVAHEVSAGPSAAQVCSSRFEPVYLLKVAVIVATEIGSARLLHAIAQTCALAVQPTGAGHRTHGLGWLEPWK